jgi:hypothetical protein
MPFCIECGKEITARQRYCEHCGALQDHVEPDASPEAPAPPKEQISPPLPLQVPQSQAAPPLVPQSSPAPPQPAPSLPPEVPQYGAAPPPPPLPPVLPPAPPGHGKGKTALPKNAGIIIGAAAVLVLVIAFYVYGLPLVQETGLFHQRTMTVPTPSAVPTTPVPTVRVSFTTVPTTPAPVIVLDDRYEKTYVQVHASNRTYTSGERFEVPYELTHPPLFIKFNVIPEMVNRTKLADIGLSTEHTVYAVYPDPNSWFEIKVLKGTSRMVIDSNGFNKDYGGMTQGQFMVREPGNYVVEISGHLVTAYVQIMAGSP